MLIGFIGDMHGRAFHALAAIITLQQKLRRRFGLVIQVGDFGYPDMERADEPTKPYLAVDPAEADLSRLMGAEGSLAQALRDVREQLVAPIVFVRGNHEDFEWLASLKVDGVTRTAPADPFDLVHYVPDGAVLDFAGFRIAFLGGVEELPGEPGFDMTAYRSLIENATFDLLVTHEGPYGSSTGYHGDTHGSTRIIALVEQRKPAFHVFGHAHQVFGPKSNGRTTMLGLDGLVASRVHHPEERGLKIGCLGALDTATGELRATTDQWLREFPTPFDFDAWARENVVAPANSD